MESIMEKRSHRRLDVQLPIEYRQVGAGRLNEDSKIQGGRKIGVEELPLASGQLDLERRSRWDRQRVQAAGPGCAEVRYFQGATGIEIAVQCERLDPRREPRPEAFSDPDAPEQSCSDEPGASS